MKQSIIITIGEIIDHILHYKAYHRKLEAEARLTEIEGIEKTQQIYRNLVADQKAMIKELEKEKSELERQYVRNKRAAGG